MNSTSRAILQTVQSTDASLTSAERAAVQRLIDGQVESPVTTSTQPALELKLVPQKRAADLLSVSRSTIWRMTKEGLLHPVEILPGTWRYPLHEIAHLIRKGANAGSEPQAPDERSAA